MGTAFNETGFRGQVHKKEKKGYGARLIQIACIPAKDRKPEHLRDGKKRIGTVYRNFDWLLRDAAMCHLHNGAQVMAVAYAQAPQPTPFCYYWRQEKARLRRFC